MRPLVVICSCVAFLSALSISTPIKDTAKASPRFATCPAFRHINPERLPKRLNDDPDGALLETVLYTWLATQPGPPSSDGDFDAQIVVSTDDGYTIDLMHREVVARRRQGVWQVFGRSRSMRDGMGGWSNWRHKQVSPRGNERLSLALADECLWNAPRFLDQQIPLRDGSYIPSFDSPSNTYDVQASGRRWSGHHAFWTLGPPGRLRAILVSEAFGLPEWANEDLPASGPIHARDICAWGPSASTADICPQPPAGE